VAEHPVTTPDVQAAHVGYGEKSTKANRSEARKVKHNERTLRMVSPDARFTDRRHKSLLVAGIVRISGSESRLCRAVVNETLITQKTLSGPTSDMEKVGIHTELWDESARLVARLERIDRRLSDDITSTRYQDAKGVELIDYH